MYLINNIICRAFLYCQVFGNSNKYVVYFRFIFINELYVQEKLRHISIQIINWPILKIKR